jgi:hypothetical protein
MPFGILLPPSTEIFRDSKSHFQYQQVGNLTRVFFLGGGGRCSDALVLGSIVITLLSIESIKTSKSERERQARETDRNKTPRLQLKELEEGKKR